MARPVAVPLAVRVCDHARRAARQLGPGAVGLRIADRTPANIECVLHVSGRRLDVVAQASAQAWLEFDTTSVHQSQAFGSGALHEPDELPLPVSVPGAIAQWIPAQQELFATNGSATRGGSYVTVTVTGGSRDPRARRQAARAVLMATLPVAPRGPRPGATS